MNEPYLIECEYCGAMYSDLEEMCPHCGQPQAEEFTNEYEEDYQDEAEFLPDDAAYNQQDDFFPSKNNFFVHDIESDYLTDETAFSHEQSQYVAPEVQTHYDEYGQPIGRGYFGRLDYHDDEIAPKNRAFKGWQIGLGCLTLLLCVGLYFGGIGLLAVYQGLKEQATETDTQVRMHYERGRVYLEGKNFERAIAEFEYALSLDPNFSEARQALVEARKLVQNDPTPTSVSHSTATSALFDQAEKEITQRKWLEAEQTLTKLRDLDLSYQVERVSEMLYTANYQLGLQLLSPEHIEEAKLAFERALAERPDDPKAKAEQNKATLYVQGQQALADNKQAAVERFSKLYQLEPTYLDVEARLLKGYELWGDELAIQKDWCQAEIQYTQAIILKPDQKLRDKAANSGKQCKESVSKSTLTPTVSLPVSSPTSTPVSPPTGETKEKEASKVTPTATMTASSTVAAEPTATVAPPAPSSKSGGSLVYSVYNKDEREWHILAVPSGGGTANVLVKKGIMPAVSRSGRWLLYRSELSSSEGLHLYDLTNGQDKRVTIFRQDVLPRWGADEGQFLFTAQEPGTDHWQVHNGFTNGHTQAKILLDGRTPDWGIDGTIAYQGKTIDGNNPGIYLAAFVGDPTRLTMHESDRSPDFSPDGSQLAYMSTQGGNWDIYIVNRKGGTPRQLTTYPGNDGLPVWSPDGSQIGYVSDAGGSWAIYIVNANGGTPTKVVAWDSFNRPDWLMEQIDWMK